MNMGVARLVASSRARISGSGFAVVGGESGKAQSSRDGEQERRSTWRTESSGASRGAACKRSASALARLEAVTSGLELRVLGAIEVVRAGEPVPIGGPKPRLALALLAAHRGSVISTDRICEELWEHDQPAD